MATEMPDEQGLSLLRDAMADAVAKQAPGAYPQAMLDQWGQAQAISEAVPRGMNFQEMLRRTPKSKHVIDLRGLPPAVLTPEEQVLDAMRRNQPQPLAAEALPPAKPPRLAIPAERPLAPLKAPMRDPPPGMLEWLRQFLPQNLFEQLQQHLPAPRAQDVSQASPQGGVADLYKAQPPVSPIY